MRRSLFLCALAALCLPVLATGAVSDGTLSVRNATGQIRIDAKGAVIGRCDSCRFILNDKVEGDGGAPVVSGAESARDIDDDGDREWFQGTNVRFRLVGGSYRLWISGKDVDLSVVGQGRVRLRGTAGTYSLNGDEPRPLPDDWRRLLLTAPPAP